MGRQLSSSEIVFLILVMLSYVVLVVTLFKLFQFSYRDSNDYLFSSTYYSFIACSVFEFFLVPLTGFPYVLGQKYTFIEFFFLKCTFIEFFYRSFFVAAFYFVTMLYNNSFLVSIASAALCTAIALVLQLRCGGGCGSPPLSRSVIIASFMGAIFPAVRECWLLTVAAIIPAIPSMIEVLVSPPIAPKAHFAHLAQVGYSFKLEHPLESRQAETARIREKYPDRIPVIVERAEKTDVPDIKKYLVPADITVGQFADVLLERIKRSREKCIFISVTRIIPPTAAAAMMSAIYEENKDEDGFLYMTYSVEKAFMIDIDLEDKDGTDSMLVNLENAVKELIPCL